MSSLDGKRILIVEDEAYIAFDLKRLLADRGATVLGPVQNVAGAAALLDGGKADAAVLDMNLNGELSYPLAERLQAAGVPYMFLTGYDGWSIAEAFRSAPCLAKPFATAEVLAMVEQLCTRDHPSR